MNKKDEKVRINLAQLKMQDIDGSYKPIDVMDEIARLIYMGSEMKHKELGMRMYNAGRTNGQLSDNPNDREMEISQSDVELIMEQVPKFPYVIREAMYKALGIDEK